MDAVELPTWGIVVLVVVVGGGVFSFLYTLACRLWWELKLHDLAVDARSLRIEQERRIAAARAGNVVELHKPGGHR